MTGGHEEIMDLYQNFRVIFLMSGERDKTIRLVFNANFSNISAIS
jgi:hypothetical protein